MIDSVAQTPVNLNGDQATFTTNTLTAGNHSITAVYDGDSNFAPSTSSAATVSVSQSGDTPIILNENSGTLAYGQYATFYTAILPANTGAPTATGTVQFIVDGKVTLTVTLASNGQDVDVILGYDAVLAPRGDMLSGIRAA